MPVIRRPSGPGLWLPHGALGAQVRCRKGAGTRAPPPSPLPRWPGSQGSPAQGPVRSRLVGVDVLMGEVSPKGADGVAGALRRPRCSPVQTRFSKSRLSLAVWVWSGTLPVGGLVSFLCHLRCPRCLHARSEGRQVPLWPLRTGGSLRDLGGQWAPHAGLVDAHIHSHILHPVRWGRGPHFTGEATKVRRDRGDGQVSAASEGQTSHLDGGSSDPRASALPRNPQPQASAARSAPDQGQVQLLSAPYLPSSLALRRPRLLWSARRPLHPRRAERACIAWHVPRQALPG